MIKLTATAIIYSISPVMQVTENYQKRELILDDSWTKDGKTYPSLVCIEFTGAKMEWLDNFMPGQRVTVEAYVSGRENKGRYYHTLRAQSITPYQDPQAVQSAPQAVPGGYPPPPPYTQPNAYPASGGYGQQPQQSYPRQQYQPPYPPQQPYQQQGGYATSPALEPGNLGPDNLPFR